ncbi:MAG: proton-conducting membrane transporter [Rhizobiales bacterium]|nr:proton-conducting membrane transporter [Hyphomicrobiales bacterium]
MLHYLIELALLLLAAYIAGACVGCLLRKLFGSEASADATVTEAAVDEPVAPVAATLAAAPAVAAAVTMAERPAPAPAAPVAAQVERVAPPPPPPPPVAAAPAPAPVQHSAVPAPLAATGKMERPKGIAAARGGKADNLQRISGIGPKNEKILHSLGFFHFDQIGAWTREQVAWVDDHLRFNGRIAREEWIKQARLLADGKDAEFTRLYGTGGLKNREGDKLSGSRTRRT